MGVAKNRFGSWAGLFVWLWTNMDKGHKYYQVINHDFDKPWICRFLLPTWNYAQKKWRSPAKANPIRFYLAKCLCLPSPIYAYRIKGTLHFQWRPKIGAWKYLVCSNGAGLMGFDKMATWDIVNKRYTGSFLYEKRSSDKKSENNI